MKKYQQLALGEREKIYLEINNNKSFRQIAKQINRSPSTVSREVARNSSFIGYLPDGADSNSANRKDDKTDQT